MGFYDEEETAKQYISMADGYDGQILIDVLRKHVPDGSAVLELGMGPGVDLDILDEHYKVTGSDNSQYFLDRYQKNHCGADLLNLDAVTLQTERKFDCIYSNKVLHHLLAEDLVASIRRQKALLSEGGLVLHSFWHGDGAEEHHGLRFVYQTEAAVRDLFGQVFNVLGVVVYGEMEDGDSLYVVASV